MKAKKCNIVFNTKHGYCMTPIKCRSIRQATNLAHERGMAFRIYVGSKCVHHGWYAN